MIEKLRENYFNKTTQFIIIDRAMSVIASDDCLFSIRTQSKLTDFHPFFYALEELFDKPEESARQTFYCVQMEVLARNYFLDIQTFKRDDETLVVVLNDLTTHYKSVHQIKQVRNESVINFNVSQELNKQLEIQSDFKNKFLANVSHEIRTPLNSILGFISILENTDLNREQLDILSIVKSSSKSLVTILEDLMDITRIEAGKLEIKNRRFDFRTFIETLGKTYKFRAQEKRLEFNMHLGTKIPRYLVGDQLRLSQILINLLENAIKYTHKGSVSFDIDTASINARKIPVTFTVTDTGIGIPKEKRSKIFESFTQLEHKELFSGAGLGLSIVRQLTQLLGTDLELTSEVNEGSKFTFTAKLGVSHNQKKDTPVTKSTEKPASTKKKPRILLGEDTEINQMLMVKLFANHGGYSLDVAKNGERVLAFLNNYNYDLIIMDLAMPIMDGLDTTVHIRKHTNKKIAKLPIIALTARNSQEQREEAKEVGINAYLTKPLDEKLLFETVDKYLNRYKRKDKK